ETVDHVRIRTGEALGSLRRFRVEDQQRTVGRIAKGAREDQLTARVCLAKEREVLGAVACSFFDEPIDHVIGQGVMLHWLTARRMLVSCRRCSRSCPAYSRIMCSTLSSPRSACTPTRRRSSVERPASKRRFASRSTPKSRRASLGSVWS